MSGANGQDTGPLAGWAIVQLHGLSLLGRMVERLIKREGQPDVTIRRLEPVWELKAALQPVDRNGGAVPVHMCFPVWLLPSIQGVDVPLNAIIVQVTELAAPDREILARSVKAAADMMRAAKANLILAPGAKL
jgi:hypothetical protein